MKWRIASIPCTTSTTNYASVSKTRAFQPFTTAYYIASFNPITSASFVLKDPLYLLVRAIRNCSRAFQATNPNPDIWKSFMIAASVLILNHPRDGFATCLAKFWTEFASSVVLHPAQSSNLATLP